MNFHPVNFQHLYHHQLFSPLPPLRKQLPNQLEKRIDDNYAKDEETDENGERDLSRLCVREPELEPPDHGRGKDDTDEVGKYYLKRRTTGISHNRIISLMDDDALDHFRERIVAAGPAELSGYG